MELVTHQLGLLTQSALAGAESWAELKHSARLARHFRLGGWVGGWLRKVDNKAKAQHNWGLGLAELGNMGKRGNGNITNLRKIGNKNKEYKGAKKL